MTENLPDPPIAPELASALRRMPKNFFKADRETLALKIAADAADVAKRTIAESYRLTKWLAKIEAGSRDPALLFRTAGNPIHEMAIAALRGDDPGEVNQC